MSDESLLGRFVAHPIGSIAAAVAWVSAFFDPVSAVGGALWANVGSLIGVAGVANTWILPQVPGLEAVPFEPLILVLAVAYLLRKLQPVADDVQDRL